MQRILTVLTAVLCLSACGNDSGDKPAETTTTTAPSGPTTTGSTLPVTTITTLATTTTTDPKTNGGDTPKQAADGLKIAWEANSKVNAASWADQPAIDALLATPYQNVQKAKITFMACEPNAGFGNAMACSYAYEGGSVHFIMSNAIGKWRVSRVEYVAD